MAATRNLFTAIVLALFTGCGSTTISNHTQGDLFQKTPSAKMSPLESKVSQPARNDNSKLSGYGTQKSVEKAKAAALANMKKKSWQRFVAYLDSKYPGLHLDENEMKSSGNRLFALIDSSDPEYEIIETDKNMKTARATLDRKDLAKPLKKSVISRLVAVEERWHAALKKDTSTRYIVAKESVNRMQSILPDYLLLNFLTPLPSNLSKRVEDALPYFKKSAKKLKKEIRFRIEPASTPAMQRFADAVTEVLKKESLLDTGERENDGRTLCITIEGKLAHKKEAQKHIFEAKVRLLLHKPYRKPLAIEHYDVRGVSAQSGPKALEMAAKSLQKKMQKHFLQTL